MSQRNHRVAVGSSLLLVLGILGGCGSPYKGVVKPAPKLAALSPELEALSDAGLEEFLKAEARVEFPTNLAIARIGTSASRFGYARDKRSLAMISGDEADGWQKLVARLKQDGKPMISQVHFVNSLLAPDNPNLKQLRDAAAMLRAPLLLVYMQDNNYSQGPNSAAMAYWTIIGLFLVPGNTVGQHSACAGVIVETRTGVVLAVVHGDAKREENVLAGAVEIAGDRVCQQSQNEAIARLQKDTGRVITALAIESVVAGSNP